MFSLRIVTIDYYMSSPIRDLDVVYSEFRSAEVRQVPVIQIYGNSRTGDKSCLHVHGVFPYIYVPYNGSEAPGILCYKLAAELDKWLNIALGQASSNARHIHNIILVSGIPFYGYHEKHHQFFKIFFYNPAVIKKACSLLQTGTILGKLFQPYEAHIDYILQFMMDYNLHGMSFINLSNVKYRFSSEHRCLLKNISPDKILSAEILRRTNCKMEADCFASDITNTETTSSGQLGVNPGLAALWADEKQRRRINEMVTQMSFSLTQERENVKVTGTQKLYEERYADKLSRNYYLLEQITFDPDDSMYPAEVPDDYDIFKASLANSSYLDESLYNEESEPAGTNSQASESGDAELIDLLQNLKENANVEADSILSQQVKDEDKEFDEEEQNLSLPLSKITELSKDDNWNDSFWNEDIRFLQVDGANDTIIKKKWRNADEVYIGNKNSRFIPDEQLLRIGVNNTLRTREPSSRKIPDEAKITVLEDIKIKNSFSADNSQKSNSNIMCNVQITNVDQSSQKLYPIIDISNIKDEIKVTNIYNTENQKSDDKEDLEDVSNEPVVLNNVLITNICSTDNQQLVTADNSKNDDLNVIANYCEDRQQLEEIPSELVVLDNVPVTNISFEGCSQFFDSLITDEQVVISTEDQYCDNNISSNVIYNDINFGQIENEPKNVINSPDIFNSMADCTNSDYFEYKDNHKDELNEFLQFYKTNENEANTIRTRVRSTKTSAQTQTPKDINRCIKRSGKKTEEILVNSVDKKSSVSVPKKSNRSNKKGCKGKIQNVVKETQTDISLKPKLNSVAAAVENLNTNNINADTSLPDKLLEKNVVNKILRKFQPNTKSSSYFLLSCKPVKLSKKILSNRQRRLRNVRRIPPCFFCAIGLPAKKPEMKNKSIDTGKETKQNINFVSQEINLQNSDTANNFNNNNLELSVENNLSTIFESTTETNDTQTELLHSLIEILQNKNCNSQDTKNATVESCNEDQTEPLKSQIKVVKKRRRCSESKLLLNDISKNFPLTNDYLHRRLRSYSKNNFVENLENKLLLSFEPVKKENILVKMTVPNMKNINTKSKNKTKKYIFKKKQCRLSKKVSLSSTERFKRLVQDKENLLKNSVAEIIINNNENKLLLGKKMNKIVRWNIDGPVDSSSSESNVGKEKIVKKRTKRFKNQENKRSLSLKIDKNSRSPKKSNINKGSDISSSSDIEIDTKNGRQNKRSSSLKIDKNSRSPKKSDINKESDISSSSDIEINTKNGRVTRSRCKSSEESLNINKKMGTNSSIKPHFVKDITQSDTSNSSDVKIIVDKPSHVTRNSCKSPGKNPDTNIKKMRTSSSSEPHFAKDITQLDTSNSSDDKIIDEKSSYVTGNRCKLPGKNTNTNIKKMRTSSSSEPHFAKDIMQSDTSNSSDNKIIDEKSSYVTRNSCKLPGKNLNTNIKKMRTSSSSEPHFAKDIMQSDTSNSSDVKIVNEIPSHVTRNSCKSPGKNPDTNIKKIETSSYFAKDITQSNTSNLSDVKIIDEKPSYVTRNSCKLPGKNPNTNIKKMRTSSSSEPHFAKDIMQSDTSNSSDVKIIDEKSGYVTRNSSKSPGKNLDTNIKKIETSSYFAKDITQSNISNLSDVKIIDEKPSYVTRNSCKLPGKNPNTNIKKMRTSSSSEPHFAKDIMQSDTSNSSDVKIIDEKSGYVTRNSSKSPGKKLDTNIKKIETSSYFAKDITQSNTSNLSDVKIIDEKPSYVTRNSCKLPGKNPNTNIKKMRTSSSSEPHFAKDIMQSDTSNSSDVKIIDEKSGYVTRNSSKSPGKNLDTNIKKIETNSYFAKDITQSDTSNLSDVKMNEKRSHVRRNSCILPGKNPNTNIQQIVTSHYFAKNITQSDTSNLSDVKMIEKRSLVRRNSCILPRKNPNINIKQIETSSSIKPPAFGVALTVSLDRIEELDMKSATQTKTSILDKDEKLNKEPRIVLMPLEKLTNNQDLSPIKDKITPSRQRKTSLSIESTSPLQEINAPNNKIIAMETTPNRQTRINIENINKSPLKRGNENLDINKKLNATPVTRARRKSCLSSSKYSPLNIIVRSPQANPTMKNNEYEPNKKKFKSSDCPNASQGLSRTSKATEHFRVSPGISQEKSEINLNTDNNILTNCDNIYQSLPNLSINNSFNSPAVTKVKKGLIFDVKNSVNNTFVEETKVCTFKKNKPNFRGIEIWKKNEENFLNSLLNDNYLLNKENKSDNNTVLNKSFGGNKKKIDVTSFYKKITSVEEEQTLFSKTVKESKNLNETVNENRAVLLNSESKENSSKARNSISENQSTSNLNNSEERKLNWLDYYYSDIEYTTPEKKYTFTGKETLSQKCERELFDNTNSTKNQNLTVAEKYDLARNFAPQPGTSTTIDPVQSVGRVLNFSQNSNSSSLFNFDNMSFNSTYIIDKSRYDQSFFDEPYQKITEILDSTVIDKNSSIWMPKYFPPTIGDIISSFAEYNIPEHKFQEPFFSDCTDVTGRVDIGYNSLKILSKSYTDLEEFDSCINFSGIESWRKTKYKELYSWRENSKTSLRVTLAGHSEFIITPVFLSPTRDETISWLISRNEIVPQTELEKRSKKNRIFIPLSPENGYNSCDESMTLSPCTPEISTPKQSQDIIETPTSSQESPSLNRRRKSNRKGNLQKKVLFSQSLKLSQNNSDDRNVKHLSDTSRNDSCQITGVTLDNTHGFQMSYENLQDARALTEHQYLTILVVELHIRTRGDLNPDPQYDSVRSIFYSIYNDVPENFILPRNETGVIVIDSLTTSPSKNKNHQPILDGCGLKCEITYVKSEMELIDEFVKLIRKWDPDIFTGYEIEMLSWGYLIDRCYVIGINLPSQISRLNPTILKNKSAERPEPSVEIKLSGRIVLDIWRLLRHEIALQSYTFENLMYHILHQRVPKHSFKNLSFWWDHSTNYYRHITANYYIVRVEGILKLIDQLDLIGRTSELARLFGIQFFEVLSRGSQFRVESMMLRLAKPLNYIPVSPSVQQRAKMRAPEWLPLILEPESRFYVDPIIVLDFQSLYPSIIIAYNYCFSTCIGRVEKLGTNEPFEFGATQLKISRDNQQKLENRINFSPCGVGFVKSDVRKGILPRMLQEILETRLMVKNSMKENKDNKLLQRVLHNRQLGLKLIANVTYGYTAANFSGRMACCEVADSVVSKGRETLERAIKTIEETAKWRARVVYGDTDSLFVQVMGRSREQAFEIGQEIADAVTRDNPPPVKLKLEKIYQPCILQTKKRYVGYMYESKDQKEPEYNAKGIETVRRDGCPAVAKMLEKSLRILFETRDVTLVKRYICRQFTKLFTGRVSIQDLTFAKEYRGSSGYRPGACVPALELARRWTATDKRKEPRRSERVPYVIVYGPPSLPLIRLVKSPIDLLNEEQSSLRPNAVYYITKVIIPPLNRCFTLIGADVNYWYNAMPRKHFQTLPTSIHFEKSKKSTISQYFATMDCAVCGTQTREGLCEKCFSRPQATLVILHEKLNRWEQSFEQVKQICQSCCGRIDQIECLSLDCPVFYKLNQNKRDLKQVPFVRSLLTKF